MMPSSEATTFAVQCCISARKWRADHPHADAREVWQEFAGIIAVMYDGMRPEAARKIKGAGQQRVEDPPTALMLRIGKIFGRRSTTRWTKAELVARRAAPGIPAGEWRAALRGLIEDATDDLIRGRLIECAQGSWQDLPITVRERIIRSMKKPHFHP